MSRVDVFVPCYKYAHYLRACVRSVLLQDGVDVRVLILDDCSPDNTPEVARQLMSEDGRVEYHRNPVNRGHIDTYNIGIEWCSGDYCLLLSADDLLTPGALGRAARVMDEHPEVSLTYGGVINVIGEAEPSGFEAPPLTAGYQVVSGLDYIQRACLTGENHVPTPTAVVRTATQKQLGGYRSDLPHSGDMEMWLRIAANADLAVVDASQAYYRMHGRNMSSDYYASMGLRDLRQRLAAFEAVFAAFGSRIPDVERLQAAARSALAARGLDVAVFAFYHDQMDLCDAALSYAAETWPDIRRRAAFGRLRRRRLLGTTLYRSLRRVAGVMRSGVSSVSRRARPSSG